MIESRSLLYFRSTYIYDFIVQNPLHEKTWSNEKKELAKRGGVGDSAGMPPTPSVYEFLVLLHTKKDLFSQDEFWKHCYAVWHRTGFFDEKTTEQKKGLQAKAYRNFYPSMIDSLHVWSLLSESGHFSRCYLDAYDDVIGKYDISVVSNAGNIYKIGLRADTKASQSCFEYKQENRDIEGRGENVISVTLPIKGRERGDHTGNKRWYCIEDFAKLLEME